MDFKTILVLACVAAGSLAGPVRETPCAEVCESRDDEGIFRAFKSYYFSYAVDIDSRINGAESDQSSTVRVEATVVIEGLSTCDMMLKFSDVSILERRQDGIMVATETSSTFSDVLMAHFLRFSMESNGTITSLCPEAGEEIWALNIKRGFLSHIQTMRPSHGSAFGQGGIFETTVTGTCMSMYSSTGDQTFTKTQDYLMCTHRTNLNMFADAIPIHPLAPTSSPLSSRMECEYEMDGQSISSVECHETHTLRPFAESDSKPETVVHTVITNIDVWPTFSSSFLIRSEFTRRTTLLYEDPIQVLDTTSDDVRETISQLCDSITYGISSETPHICQELIKQFGDLDTDNMNTVINGIFRICSPSETNKVINIVKDALTDCDTEQCAQGFHSIIQSENSAENGFYLKKWFMKLAFHKNPTKNMIGLVWHHVSDHEMNLQAYNALSAMIHQYCHKSQDDCSRDSDIVAAASVFEDNLLDSCVPENETDQKKMLMSLRAIGNMGLVMRKSLLNRCNREQNPANIRVAAIEAYRRTSCDVVPIDQFMRIFSTTNNDNELRIAAYRAIIRCPSAEVLLAIHNTMTIEPTTVTCYVSGHLSNLRNSQDPMVADLQNAISESPLAHVTKCGMGYRKFYGLSYYDDEYGNGIHIDSDVVFSNDSYLPKSARLGVNVDIFGYGINLFEVDARAEGWQEVIKSVTEFSEDEQDANIIDKASIATRVLGNDVFYKDSDDIQQMVEMFRKDTIMEIISSLATQSTHEYSMNKNFKPSKVTIPTMVGMPLAVNIQGAINTVLKASGKLDVMGMVAKPRRMAIQGVFEPSAAIEIHCQMLVDAHCARSGLSYKTNLATSLNLGGSLSFENGMFKVKVDAPPHRQTFIKASSSLYFMQMNEMVPSSERVIDFEENLSNPRFNLHISSTRPVAPFSMPEALFQTWGMEISVDKLEESLVSYNLEAGFRTDEAFRNGKIVKTDHLHFLIGAPGSEMLGVYSMDLAYHRSNKTLFISIEDPWGSTYLKGVFFKNDTLGRLTLSPSPHKSISIQGGYWVEETPSSRMITPIFSITLTRPELFIRDDGPRVIVESLSIVGGPLVISDTGVTLNELYLTGTTIEYRTSRMIEIFSKEIITLIEMFNLYFNKEDWSFGFQGNIMETFIVRETIPFGFQFDMNNDERRQYSVNAVFGEYKIKGRLSDGSSETEAIYGLEVATRINSIEYFNITSEFRDGINTFYVDTVLKFRDLRTKIGLNREKLSAKNRYTPIFILESDQQENLSLEGSMDISESGILINNMAYLVGVEDIFRLWGSAFLDRSVGSISWLFNAHNYMDDNVVVLGSASYYENMVTFHTSIASDPYSSKPDYSINIDLQNSTRKGQIFSWDGKIELEMPHHPELSFRMDTEYILTPGHSTGDVFRLCYDGINCTSTDKRITLGHDITFERDRFMHTYNHDLEVTYTHPAVNEDMSLEWTTSCQRGVSYGTEFTIKYHEEILFLASVPNIPARTATNTSVIFLARSPGFFDYESRHIFNFKDRSWLSQYRSGEDIISFLVRFDLMLKENQKKFISIFLEYTDIMSDFTYETMDSKKDGELITTLRLPKTSITFLSELEIEMGVPSANLSIKFQPLLGSTETYAIEFAMKNKSTSMRQSYDTALIFNLDPTCIYGLRNTLEYSADTMFPMTTTLSGFCGDEEVSIASSVAFNETRNMRSEVDLSFSFPEHVYLLSGRFDLDSCNITITKDSMIIWTSNLTQELEQFDPGYTYNFAVLENVSGFGTETTMTLSSISNSKAFNLQVRENNREIICTNFALDIFPGQSQLDVAVEARSDYLPAHTSLNFHKMRRATTLNTSLSIDDNDVFSISLTNGSLDENSSRTTQIILRQPTNPDPRLRQFVLADSGSMIEGKTTHNTTLMWGNLLPTQSIAVQYTGISNDAGASAKVTLHNEGHVFGLDSWYNLDLGNTKTGSESASSITFAGQNGNIISLETEITNRSMNYTKNYNTSVSMTVLDKQPIKFSSNVVQNSSNIVLDADVTINYSDVEYQELTGGIEVTQEHDGNSIMLNLRHSVNTADVHDIGSISTNHGPGADVILRDHMWIGSKALSTSASSFGFPEYSHFQGNEKSHLTSQEEEMLEREWEEYRLNMRMYRESLEAWLMTSSPEEISEFAREEHAVETQP